MSLPIATVGDTHTCPMFTGTTPHVGGTIITGASSVFLNGKAIARMGDQCICADGSISIIVQGHAGVLVQGKPIAYVGCMTSHGGVISSGQPHAFLRPSGESASDVAEVVNLPIELLPPQPARNMLDYLNKLKNSKKAKLADAKQSELKKHGYLVDIDYSI